MTVLYCSVIPLRGVLQGNAGAPPATWVIISTVLLDMLRKVGNGRYFITPISNHHSHWVGYAFFDDTNLTQYDSARDQTMTVNETMQKMQDMINSRWEGSLKVTGGAIVPDKSFLSSCFWI